MTLTIHNLDKMWQYLVKSRAGCRCEMCGDDRNGLQAHHINSRGRLWTRWDKRNGVAVCLGGCHDERKVLEWLEANDPKRYRWIMKQRATVHRGRIDLNRIRRKLEMSI